MNSLAQRLARPEILALARQSSQMRAVTNGAHIRLNANENPFSPLSNERAFADLNRFPPDQPQALVSRLSDLYGVALENITLSRGARDGVELMLRGFCRPGEDAVAVARPTSDYYAHGAVIHGARIIEAPLREDFAFDAGAFVDLIRGEGGAKIAFLCSPNNPTGGVISGGDVERLCADLPDTLVVIDESYVEFNDAESLARATEKFENLIVLRSLSIAYGLAGARCGAAIANPEIASILRKVATPSALPSPTIAAALAALSPVQAPIVARRIADIVAERERMHALLAASPEIVRAHDSAANFLFLEARDERALKRRLAARGVLVEWRPDAAPAGLRLSIGTREENDLALDALGVAVETRAARRADVARTTKETEIAVAVDLDRAEPIKIDTKIAFFDHMLEQVARHAGFSVILACKGDLDVDAHHTIEDCALSLGEAVRRALGERRGIRRFGGAIVMDEARAEIAIDLSGRPFSAFEGSFTAAHIGAYPTEMTSHVMRSFADSLGASIHLSVAGENDHHKTESCYKALGRALRDAIRIESADVPSSKGVLG